MCWMAMNKSTSKAMTVGDIAALYQSQQKSATEQADYATKLQAYQQSLTGSGSAALQNLYGSSTTSTSIGSGASPSWAPYQNATITIASGGLSPDELSEVREMIKVFRELKRLALLDESKAQIGRLSEAIRNVRDEKV